MTQGRLVIPKLKGQRYGSYLGQISPALENLVDRVEVTVTARPRFANSGVLLSTAEPLGPWAYLLLVEVAVDGQRCIVEIFVKAIRRFRL